MILTILCFFKRKIFVFSDIYIARNPYTNLNQLEILKVLLQYKNLFFLSLSTLKDRPHTERPREHLKKWIVSLNANQLRMSTKQLPKLHAS